MEKLAVTKQVRISPYKAREVARLIQGKGAVEALNMVSLIPRKAARLIEKTLKSAIANAENDEKAGVDRNRLIVKEALIGEGPTLKQTHQPHSHCGNGRGISSRRSSWVKK